MRTSALRLFASGCAAMILTACPGDDAAGADESSSSGDTEDPTADATLESTVDPETTVTPTTDDTTTVDPTSGGSTAADTTGTSESSSGGASSSGEASSSSEGSGTTGDEPCVDQTLGAVPVVVMVDTTGQGDDFYGSCAGGINAPDVTLEFTAEVAGDYLFTTRRDATDVDTVLYLIDGTCDGEEIACNDDFDADGGEYSSLLVEPLLAGQTVIVVVDGYDADRVGQVELAIDLVPAPGDGGGCCTGNSGVGGCDEGTFEACVCAFDEFCCAGEWDEECVTAGTEVCGMTCAGETCEPEIFDGALDAGDSTVHRIIAADDGGRCILGGDDAVFYDVYDVMLVGPGPHTLVADACDAGFDSLVNVYQSPGGGAAPFDPEAPCDNLVGHSDDAAGCGTGSSAEVSGLGAGSVQVVVHAYDNDEVGAYTLTLTSDSCG